MNLDKIIFDRQIYNLTIFTLLEKYYPQFNNYYSKLKEKITDYPNQRFGQIICNYICSDYYNKDAPSETLEFVQTIFPNNPDPFYEESYTTLKRIYSQLKS
jgi:hypothetical protein